MDSYSTFEEMLRKVVRLETDASAPGALPCAGEIVAGKYRVDEKLGQGGMGAVFRATHVESGKPVALKWLLACSPQARVRLVREAQAAAQIDHPNAVNVFDVGTHGDGRFLVMELLHGESLRARLRRGRLEPDALVRVMIPVLRGLGAAHAAGVIHRDLKPDNVFLCVAPDGSPREPKIVDFGVSKLRRTDGDEHLTEEGTCLGTRVYMAPEQRDNAPHVDERADLYAAGVMMYEALTGALPCPEEDASGALQDAGVPPALSAIILRALSAHVAERHASAEALSGDLEAWARAVPAGAQEDGALARPVRPARAGVIRAAVALAVLAAGASWALVHTGPERAEPQSKPVPPPPFAPSPAPIEMLAVSTAGPMDTASAATTDTPHDTPEPAARPSDASFEAPSLEPSPSVPAPAPKAAPRARPVESRAGRIRRAEL